MAVSKIRIKLKKAYDHEVIDKTAKSIVDTAERTGAFVFGPVPLPTKRSVYTVIRGPFKDKDSPRALPDAHAQAPDRYPTAHAPHG